MVQGKAELVVLTNTQFGLCYPALKKTEKIVLITCMAKEQSLHKISYKNIHA